MKSKILEYIKLVPKGLANPVKVLEGWINDYNFDNLPKEEVEETEEAEEKKK
jgi:hypothetical protein